MFLILLPRAAFSATVPLIALAAVWGNDQVESLNHDYATSVYTAGGIPLVVPVTSNATLLDLLFERVDGALLPGGIDVSPLIYGQEPVPALGEVEPPLDDFQLKFIGAAVKAGIPLFGICRGIQIMNVYFGGTLYQDIPTTYSSGLAPVKHQQSPTKKRYVSHKVSILNGTNLKSLLGKGEVVTNSFHHQAVRDVAPGFRVTAVAQDGIIEGIEKIDDPRIYAVQWHPEGTVGAGDYAFLSLFQYLVDQARAVQAWRDAG